ncbi:MAG TPA: hypothetical protein DEH02_05105 [Bacteroidales bacterium]|nr:MAG: hypothetical protein A2X01_21025 [Bacteroidetes bacterium GWF2_35_48]OFY94403.1 MAG: hypothetical protein A2491_00305 [Bacteroidetes bacterium RIFOXYC12_FULL_35_7]HBX50431.1 hypothetical protein [Bacteroidales bacterium]
MSDLLAGKQVAAFRQAQCSTLLSPFKSIMYPSTLLIFRASKACLPATARQALNLTFSYQAHKVYPWRYLIKVFFDKLRQQKEKEAVKSN